MGLATQVQHSVLVLVRRRVQCCQRLVVRYDVHLVALEDGLVLGNLRPSFKVVLCVDRRVSPSTVMSILLVTGRFLVNQCLRPCEGGTVSWSLVTD